MPGLSEIPQRHADLTDEAAARLAALDAGSADVVAFETWRAADIRHAVAPAEPIVTALPSRRHVLRAVASVAAVVAIGGGFAYRAAAREMATTPPRPACRSISTPIAASIGKAAHPRGSGWSAARLRSGWRTPANWRCAIRPIRSRRDSTIHSW